MKKILIFLFLVWTTDSFAQLTKEQRIQDSVIGWWSNNYWDRHWKSPTDSEGKIIEKHVNNFVDWMKKSYTPVAGLGTVTRFRDSWGYGVKFYVWNVSYCCNGKYLDEKGNFKPVSEENTPFYIHVNQIVGAHPMAFLNKNGDYYFTWMADGTGDLYVHQKKDPRPVGVHPNASKFITVRNNYQSVMLAPDNKLPFVEVTKGELLEKSDKALAQMIVSGNQSKKQDYERYRQTISELKVEYKSNLNEPAVVRNIQSDEYMFNFSDPFESDRNGNPLYNYKVYKLAPGVWDNMKKAQPQWVTIYYPFVTKENGTQLNELYTALTQNLNYEYIYSYFFTPDKIKGKAYTPSDELGLKTRLDGYRHANKQGTAVKPASKKNASNAYFADDFSDNIPGGRPQDWFFNKAKEHVEVRKLNGYDGIWMQLGRYNEFRPGGLPYPLPKSFRLEFDLITDTDFSTRTGGVATLTLNTRKMLNNGGENTNGNGEKLIIIFASGAQEALNSNNFRGAVTMEVKGTPSRNKQNGTEGAKVSDALINFTNRKPKIHVTVTVQNGTVEVFVNERKSISSRDMKLAYGGNCISCGLETTSMINSVNWSATTEANTDKIKIYLGNVRITKI
ncbi:hypothetical protein [Niabella aurantiaca]|uniref:hypothetical protein n=1 Tax=Niabella aurantiaca TaxID=379900 RepID=UPI00039FC57D|nr:hypothetical protein [Niabella aurantiaca]